MRAGLRTKELEKINDMPRSGIFRMLLFSNNVIDELVSRKLVAPEDLIKVMRDTINDDILK